MKKEEEEEEEEEEKEDEKKVEVPHIIPPNYSRWGGEGDGDGDGDGGGGSSRGGCSTGRTGSPSQTDGNQARGSHFHLRIVPTEISPPPSIFLSWNAFETSTSNIYLEVYPKARKLDNRVKLPAMCDEAFEFLSKIIRL
ncbi:hypothetical protein HZH66_014546 [Vespula vulgaris]|uniref:Uncharacterized protein n=1 Tax=Vespula vulgaris TaxID=7454 RepID=A0A834J702_VESVU|nr:hypothetical protein HZH66_014546 [Vespula vulgaris]